MKMNKTDWLAMLDKHFHEAKRDFILQISSVGRRQFLAEASQAWDRARAKYGDFDLDQRNPLQEAGKEAHDGIEYRCEHLRRKASMK